jgi:hypothetical protein
MRFEVSCGSNHCPVCLDWFLPFYPTPNSHPRFLFFCLLISRSSCQPVFTVMVKSAAVWLFYFWFPISDHPNNDSCWDLAPNIMVLRGYGIFASLRKGSSSSWYWMVNPLWVSGWSWWLKILDQEVTVKASAEFIERIVKLPHTGEGLGKNAKLQYNCNLGVI